MLKQSNFYFISDETSKTGLEIALSNQFERISYKMQIFPDTSRQYEFDAMPNIQDEDVAILYYRFSKPFEADVVSILRLKKYLQNYFKNIVLITPFMPFLREHYDARHTDSCFLFDDLKILTIDAHITWENIISVQPEWVKTIINPTDLIVFPDYGAKRYISWIDNEYIIAKKDREIGLIFDEPEKIAGRDCIILDDILDTGYTLNKAIKQLQLYRARSIKAYITHYLGNLGPLKLKLNFQGLDFLYIYDTVLEEESRKMLTESIDNVIIFDHTKAFSDLKEKLCILTNLN